MTYTIEELEEILQDYLDDYHILDEYDEEENEEN